MKFTKTTCVSICDTLVEASGEWRVHENRQRIFCLPPSLFPCPPCLHKIHTRGKRVRKGRRAHVYVGHSSFLYVGLGGLAGACLFPSTCMTLSLSFFVFLFFYSFSLFISFSLSTTPPKVSLLGACATKCDLEAREYKANGDHAHIHSLLHVATVATTRPWASSS